MPHPPLRVLIVEDEALLAMDIEAIVADCGHDVVAEAASLVEVGALHGLAPPDLAFVDIQLAEGSNGLDVAALIRRQWTDTAVVFVTANPKKVPDDFAGAYGIIPKPFSRSGLMAAMRYIEEGLCDPPPVSQPPRSFLTSPAVRADWAAAGG
ncbi:response regulator [Sphingomonas montana]|uniref:response regulator n=1 Tax=Sphingomonas montana TaxID=1843236 RepID=UPI001F0AD885|nr:response regulator [Sphingomonas montana]